MYLYTDENRFDQPNTYMYPAFGGPDFLQAYFNNRINSISYLKRALNKDCLLIDSTIINNDTHNHLLNIKEHLEKDKLVSVLSDLEMYIQKFEVAKRLRNSYPVSNSTDLAPVQTHILFYKVIINAYLLNNDVRYINVILKVSDNLISIKKSIISRDDINQLIFLLEKEVKLLNKFMVKMAVQL